MIPSMDMTNYVILSLPAFSALICLTMYLYSFYLDTDLRKDREVRISLTGYFLTVFFNWITINIFVHTSHFQVEFYPLCYVSVLLTQVFFYRFIYTITRLPGDKAFSGWHYVLPILLGIISAVWSFLTPVWVLDQIVESVGQPVDKYPVFSRFVVSYYKARLLYDIVYTVFSLRRIRRYRKEVGNYASQLQQSYMRWLNLLIGLVVVLIIGSTIATVISDRIVAVNKWAFIPIILLVMQHILILYNTLIRNFIILDDIPEEDSHAYLSVVENDKAINILGKREFEKFLAEKMPYTNKDLKITDLAKLLNTNRTYLSIFINTTYGMNFSYLINERRLWYLEEMRKSPVMKDKTNIELIYIAGFGSYQSYLRAKERETKRSILKV